MTRKPSLGRQKIRMEKIAVKNHLQVTFSKRRSGLFKKASELSTLCDVHLAVVVFSPAQKVFSFGHPNVDSILHRYNQASDTPAGDDAGDAATRRIMEARRGAKLRELNEELSHAARLLEEARRMGEVLEKVRKVRRASFWWEDSVEDMGMTQLQQLRFHLEQLKRNAVGNGGGPVALQVWHPPPPLPLPFDGAQQLQPPATGEAMHACNADSFISIHGFGFHDGDAFF